MSGTPTETEIQAQWADVVDILETFRAHVDGTQLGSGGKFDALIQSLEGEFTPSLTTELARIRSLFSSVIDPSSAQSMLSLILSDYGNLISTDTTDGFGGTYEDTGQLMRALYEWFIANSLTVESRAMVYDTTATLGASNVGDGAISRLTVDENNYALEACHAETKKFRCRRDQNSGVFAQGEIFEVLGEASSFDACLRSSFGSGLAQATTLPNMNAGSGEGGSLLTNSTFSTYSATASPKFTGWTETAGGAQLAQDTTNYFATAPGVSSNASLQITGGSGTVTIKQTLTNMRVNQLDPDAPYFFRVMLNKTVGSALGGTVTIRMGSTSASITIAALGANWQELMIAAGQNSWFRNFNEDPMDVEIEWSSSTSGTLLVDDVIFAPWELIDGTYWALRQNSNGFDSWQVDDLLTFTDTGGEPANAKIQWWNFVAFGAYLPHSGTPTFADP